jgi:Cytochrome P450
MLRKVREEHDRVFHPDRRETLKIVCEEANRLNALPLTLAVAKETLRLFSSGGSLKEPRKGCVNQSVDFVIVQLLITTDYLVMS